MIYLIGILAVLIIMFVAGYGLHVQYMRRREERITRSEWEHSLGWTIATWAVSIGFIIIMLMEVNT